MTLRTIPGEEKRQLIWTPPSAHSRVRAPMRASALSVEAGGEVIATGTPEQVAAEEASYTGQFLRALLPAVAAAA